MQTSKDIVRMGAKGLYGYDPELDEYTMQDSPLNIALPDGWTQDEWDQLTDDEKQFAAENP